MSPCNASSFSSRDGADRTVYLELESHAAGCHPLSRNAAMPRAARAWLMAAGKGWPRLRCRSPIPITVWSPHARFSIRSRSVRPTTRRRFLPGNSLSMVVRVAAISASSNVIDMASGQVRDARRPDCSGHCRRQHEVPRPLSTDRGTSGAGARTSRPAGVLLPGDLRVRSVVKQPGAVAHQDGDLHAGGSTDGACSIGAVMRSISLGISSALSMSQLKNEEPVFQRLADERDEVLAVPV